MARYEYSLAMPVSKVVNFLKFSSKFLVFEVNRILQIDHHSIAKSWQLHIDPYETQRVILERWGAHYLIIAMVSLRLESIYKHLGPHNTRYYYTDLHNKLVNTFPCMPLVFFFGARGVPKRRN